MDSSRKFFMVVVVLALLVVATEVAPAHAADCKTASTRFNGICILDSSCANMCITEGFLSGGECEGLHPRCMCKAPC
ncbi:defensin Ec-AMP-D1-like [Hordeum vulgare subsp. vulgare]|nr:defensin Ec-AMP-D1-like [Hordeum vulgare subsp. vulgare]